MKIRVIGVGSAIAGDDAVGLTVIRELSRMSLPRDVELVEAGTPGISLLELMVGVDKVVLVDALVGGDNPGRVRKLKIRDLVEKKRQIASVHEISAVEAIRLALDLMPDEMPDHIVIVGIEVSGQTCVGDSLSVELRAALPDAVQMVTSELQ